MTRFRAQTAWGPESQADGTTVFRLWAPSKEKIELVVGGPDGQPGAFHAMQKDGDGWWRLATDAVKPGGAYGFRIEGDLVVPDPAARAQAGDVHALSCLVDPHAYEWRTGEWKGRPLEECVFYELHTGTFTPEGTFDGILSRLDYLKDLGVTAIEILPVAQFSGRRGWGYDGVLLYCPHEAYGGGERLKALVDAAHERGLMVFLDVVYNHFGPDGNYLGAYAPEFFHEEVHTPWGPAIAYDAEPVRRFMIDNALYWLEEFRFDGLRLDAIDSIRDTTDTPLVKELAATVRERITDRHVHLTTEDERNITWHVERDGKGRPALVSAEWNDDFHHIAHALATKEQEGYYQDYAPDSSAQLAKALATGFVFQGEHSVHRDKNVGENSAHLPPSAFVNFLQNHDQVGNRAFGERLSVLSSRRHLNVLKAVLLLSPQLPLLFMGDEWDAMQPFCFFTDFHGELAEAVREGRRAEFKSFGPFQSEVSSQSIPDPNELQTFETSSLDWGKRDNSIHAPKLAETRHLLRLRHEKIVPLARDAGRVEGRSLVGEGDLAFAVAWDFGGMRTLTLLVNLSDTPWPVPSAVELKASGIEMLHAHPGGIVGRIGQDGLTLPGCSLVALLSSAPLFEDQTDAA